MGNDPEQKKLRELVPAVLKQYQDLFMELCDSHRQRLIERMNLVRAVSEGLFCSAVIFSYQRLPERYRYGRHTAPSSDQFLHFQQIMVELLRSRDSAALELLQQETLIVRNIAAGLYDDALLVHHQERLSYDWNGSDTSWCKTESMHLDHVQAFAGSSSSKKDVSDKFVCLVGVGKMALSYRELDTRLSLASANLRPATAREALAYANTKSPDYMGWWPARMEIIAAGTIKACGTDRISYLRLMYNGRTRQSGWGVKIDIGMQNDVKCVGGLGENRFLLCVHEKPTWF